ncbi:hypothetical protein BG006_010842 [Podila minutissima]|uniref:F-box domain-containing protein n=1 Tax=Podila minutissima TaxID=64525 RepID=A0A9P5SCR7_9FUNG|nr:hypothetical protein BG006_010842 [Podila minutissima]
MFLNEAKANKVKYYNQNQKPASKGVVASSSSVQGTRSSSDHYGHSHTAPSSALFTSAPLLWQGHGAPSTRMFPSRPPTAPNTTRSTILQPTRGSTAKAKSKVQGRQESQENLSPESVIKAPEISEKRLVQRMGPIFSRAAKMWIRDRKDGHKVKAAKVKAEKTGAPTQKVKETRAPAQKAEKTIAPAQKAEKTRAPAQKAEKTRAPAQKAEKTRAPTQKVEKIRVPAQKAENTRAVTQKAEMTRAPAQEAEKTRAPEQKAEKTRAPTQKVEKIRVPAQKAEKTRAVTQKAEMTRAPAQKAEKTSALIQKSRVQVQEVSNEVMKLSSRKRKWGVNPRKQAQDKLSQSGCSTPALLNSVSSEKVASKPTESAPVLLEPASQLTALIQDDINRHDPQSVFALELFYLILDHLPLSTVVKLIVVSKKWKAGILGYHLWKVAAGNTDTGPAEGESFFSLVCRKSSYLCDRCLSFTTGTRNRADVPIAMALADTTYHLCLACRLEMGFGREYPRNPGMSVTRLYAIKNYGLTTQMLTAIPSKIRENPRPTSMTRFVMYDDLQAQELAIATFGGWKGIDAARTNLRLKKYVDHYLRNQLKDVKKVNKVMEHTEPSKQPSKELSYEVSNKTSNKDTNEVYEASNKAPDKAPNKAGDKDNKKAMWQPGMEELREFKRLMKTKQAVKKMQDQDRSSGKGDSTGKRQKLCHPPYPDFYSLSSATMANYYAFNMSSSSSLGQEHGNHSNDSGSDFDNGAEDFAGGNGFFETNNNVVGEAEVGENFGNDSGERGIQTMNLDVAELGEFGYSSSESDNDRNDGQDEEEFLATPEDFLAQATHEDDFEVVDE